MKKALSTILLLAILAFAGTARGQNYYYSQPVINSSGLPVPGAQVAVCTTLATTAAAVANDIATLTMASNPITSGYTAGGTISVSGFTSTDTYFNGSYTVLTVSSVAITYALTHANASAGTNGVVVEAGTATTACAPLATIYVDQTTATTAPNPTTADGFGNFTFWSSPGLYFGFVYGPNVGPSLFPITSPVVSGGSSGSCPAGSTPQLQYNAGSSLCGGTANLTWTAANSTLNLLSDAYIVVAPSGSPGTLTVNDCGATNRAWPPFVDWHPVFLSDTVSGGNTTRWPGLCVDPSASTESNGTWHDGLLWTVTGDIALADIAANNLGIYGSSGTPVGPSGMDFVVGINNTGAHFTGDAQAIQWDFDSSGTNSPAIVVTPNATPASPPTFDFGVFAGGFPLNGPALTGITDNAILKFGTFVQKGSSSGAITFQTQAAAGTYNWNWPITAGTSGQVLTSGGGGSNPMTWSTPSIFNPGTTTGDTFYCTNTNTPCTTGRLGIGATGAVYQVVGGIPAWNTNGINQRAISFTIGTPGGTALTAAGTTTDYVTVPFACTISAYNLAIDAGTITVNFWKVATGTAIPTASNSISTSGVSIGSGTAIHSATVSDFTTTTVSANDILAMNVSTVSTAAYVNGVLQCTQ